ncbi:diaminopimelate epimerase, partial [Staphylococcus aureus]
LIYIPEIQSLIWQDSCGSGTASIRVFNNYQRNDAYKDFTVHQPGGNILVTSKQCHQLEYQTSIKRQVTNVATVKAYIE